MKSAGQYVPERGDIVFLDFNPQAGHEQAEKRPALVLSPLKFNKATGLCFCAPITSKVKGYAFEVPLENTRKTTGVVLSEHTRSLDFTARGVAFREKADPATVARVQQIVKAILTQ
jgi:mRNA interferase MazF